MFTPQTRPNSEQLEAIEALLKYEVPGYWGFYLFGSRVGDTAYIREDSDWDFAILPGIKPLSQSILWDLRQQLAVVMQVDAIDLVDLRAANTVLQMQIVASGIRLLTPERYHCDFFEMTTFSAYALLNEERAEILEDIHERGSIFD